MMPSRHHKPFSDVTYTYCSPVLLQNDLKIKNGFDIKVEDATNIGLDESSGESNSKVSLFLDTQPGGWANNFQTRMNNIRVGTDALSDEMNAINKLNECSCVPVPSSIEEFNSGTGGCCKCAPQPAEKQEAKQAAQEAQQKAQQKAQQEAQQLATKPIPPHFRKIIDAIPEEQKVVYTKEFADALALGNFTTDKKINAKDFQTIINSMGKSQIPLDAAEKWIAKHDLNGDKRFEKDEFLYNLVT